MARILVAGSDSTLAERELIAQLVQTIRKDGHDAAHWPLADEPAEQSAKDCDAVVAVLDRLPLDSAGLIAFARAMDKPVLGLATAGLPVPPMLAELADVTTANRQQTWFERLPSFYDEVRPFAGRLVRDRIPELVKAAGHDVRFRQLTDEEKPRFLKQKVANEAKELMAADVGQEKEEVSDLLEALEAFIAARGFSRDDLRRVKDHKKQQRGGFAQGFVVEATSDADDTEAAPEPPVETTPAVTPETAAPTPTPEPAPDAAADTDGIDFEYTDEPEPAPEAPDDLAPGREVKAEFFEL